MLLIPAAVLGYGIYNAASDFDEQKQELAQKVAEINKQIPVTRRYNSTADTWQIAMPQPTRIIPDVDLRGVPHFWVDYGNGALTREYSQPLYLANQGTLSYPSNPLNEMPMPAAGRASGAVVRNSHSLSKNVNKEFY